jgi:hypothetical protein
VIKPESQGWLHNCGNGHMQVRFNAAPFINVWQPSWLLLRQYFNMPASRLQLRLISRAQFISCGPGKKYFRIFKIWEVAIRLLQYT